MFQKEGGISVPEQPLKTSPDHTVEAWNLVTARLVESVQRTAQLAGSLSPDMQELFDTWIALISRSVLEKIGTSRTLDLEQESHDLGIPSSAYLGLLVALHRRGDLHIDQLSVRRSHDANREICSCMRAPAGSHGI